jgi:hypothetical protein
MSSTDMHKQLMLSLTENDATRLFRNNVGLGWVGKSQRMPDGSVLISNARPLHAGLVKGSSDLIGWHSIVVTPELVGKRLAVFLALEAKTGRGELEEDQINFIAAVQRAGGVAGEARSVEQVQRMLASIGR